jgi:hypothetical protein
MAFGRKKTRDSTTAGVSGEDVPFWQQPRLIIPTGFLGMVIILGLVLTLANLTGAGAEAGKPAPVSGAGSNTSAPSPPSPAGADSAASACGLPDGDQSIPASAPTDTKWVYLTSKVDRTVQIALPNSSTAGPGKVTAGGNQRSCFAHSPAGAAYAAANMGLMWSLGQARWTFENLDAPGPGRDEVLSWSDQLIRERSVPAQLAAFNVEVYTGDRTVVDISMVAGKTTATFQLTLVWAEGDWKAIVPASGLFTQPPTSTVTLIPWKGAV